MQVESALSVVGPKPIELSTFTHSFGPPGAGSNGKQRTSSLEAPIMLLTGHQSAVYSMKFNPAGTVIASGSHDRDIFLWNVHGDCKNFMVLRGHKNAVLDVQWNTDGSQIVSTSPDKTLRAWDVETGKQIKKMVGHLFVVNSCCPARRAHLLLSVDKIYTGGIDNDVKVWDLRRTDPVMKLQGHQDMITGHQHNFEKSLLRCSWSPDGSKVTAGSSDCMVYVWDTTSRRMLYKLPGHTGSVNECVFHPNEPIIGSCSSDKQIYLGEI
ncbi:hypothetical protein SASPL_131444 [Salvia splendens]|uniref:Prp8 binding protein n=1 Tax=Salvia splendens TaxID=180675 RepID=A0A8X8ZKL5_SALSN|nr:hypothetical protein SASPL_131444 [Salvia splendens]